jgi:hypothetical protein
MTAIRAEIHRPNLGSLAYVWIGDREYVAGNTHEAHALMKRRGTVTFVGRSGSVEHYTITKEEA